MTWMRRNAAWFSLYLTSSWFSNIGHGMMITVLGPTQPYLARNVGVDIDTINFVWSFGFIGYIIGSLITGVIYKKYMTSDFAKMAFLWISISLNGVGMILLPFITSFYLLAFIRAAQYAILGGYITADATVPVYTMGPRRSRPFTNALHACVGIGFLAATFLVRPFLPDDSAGSRDRDEVCFNNSTKPANEESTPVVEQELMWGLDPVAWPFIIAGVWCCVFGLGYLIVGLLPLKMPRFYEDHEGDDEDEAEVKTSEPRIQHWKPMLVGVFFFYAFSCGIERIYQPMAYTFGLCGPLQLAPLEAVVTDSTYNGGFMTGRIISVFLGGIVRPRNMIIASETGCALAAILLIAFGTVSKWGLYIGTGILGFFVSWQFGPCYSWVAQKLDITGRLAPLFFLGCGLGSTIFPPLSGYAFTSSLGAMGILYLTLTAVLLQSCVYAFMWTVSRKKATGVMPLNTLEK